MTIWFFPGPGSTVQQHWLLFYHTPGIWTWRPRSHCPSCAAQYHSPNLLALLIAFRAVASLPASDPALRPAITLQRASHLRNVGSAWMRQFKLYGPYRIRMVLCLGGTSTTQKGLRWNPSQHKNWVHRSGWEVGARRLASNELHTWRMVGWHQDITPPRKYSPKPGDSFMNS